MANSHSRLCFIILQALSQSSNILSKIVSHVCGALYLSALAHWHVAVLTASWPAHKGNDTLSPSLPYEVFLRWSFYHAFHMGGCPKEDSGLLCVTPEILLNQVKTFCLQNEEDHGCISGIQTSSPGSIWMWGTVFLSFTWIIIHY